MTSGILQESCLGEVVAWWDKVKKLNTFEEHYLASISLLRNETLMQGTKYLASDFCCFSRIMLRRNLEYLCTAKSEQLIRTPIGCKIYRKSSIWTTQCSSVSDFIPHFFLKMSQKILQTCLGITDMPGQTYQNNSINL